MNQTKTTLKQALSLLDAENPDLAAVFRSRDGDIGSGYHVTELKLASIQGVDCAGRTDVWHETLLQLSDGHGGRHMSVKKLSDIARRSVQKVPGLEDAPLFVEYAAQNAGLGRYRIEDVASDKNRVILSLVDDHAVCKPAVEYQASGNTTQCCGRDNVATACCA